MREYSGSLSGRARRAVTVSVVAALLAAGLSFLSRSASATDYDPLQDPTVTVRIDKLKAIGDFDHTSWGTLIRPNLILDVSFDQTLLSGCPVAYDVPYGEVYYPSDWSISWTFASTVSTHTIEIIIVDQKSTNVADLSPIDGRRNLLLSYDITTARWSGDNPIPPLQGYGHASGDVGDSEGCDVEIWFWITQSDSDRDGLTYWQETSGFNIGGITYTTNPQVTDYTDWDGDDLAGDSEYYSGTSPVLRDTDGDLIWDGYEYYLAPLSPTEVTDGRPYIQTLKTAFEQIPDSLLRLSIWVDHNALYDVCYYLAAQARDNYLNPVPSVAGMTSAVCEGLQVASLITEYSSTCLQGVLALLKFYEAMLVWNFAITYAYNYYDGGGVGGYAWTWENPYDTSTAGYIEQILIGEKHLDHVDQGNFVSTDLASPYWSGTACVPYPGADTLYTHFTTLVTMLGHLLGQGGSFTDYNLDGVRDFQDVLLHAKEKILPKLADTSGTVGEQHTFTRFKKLANGDLTHVRESIAGTGYKLDHGLLEWCVGVDKTFSDEGPSPYATTWNVRNIGDEAGLPSSAKVWEAAADICGILYYGYNLIKTVREAITTMVGYSDVTVPSGTITISGGARYTTSSTVTLTLSATDSQLPVIAMRLMKDGYDWESWRQYQSTVSGYTLNAYDGTRSVSAQFRDSAGNIGQTASDSIIKDSVAPTGSSVLINNGDAFATTTTVRLAVSANDATSGLYQMQLSNDGTCDSEPWEAFSTTKTWTLATGIGTKTVSMRVEDNAGNIGAQVSDTIIYDPNAGVPSLLINNGAENVLYTEVTLTIGGAYFGTGATQMRLTNDMANWPAVWITFSTSLPWSLAPGDGTKTVYLQVMDATHTVSNIATDTIRLDTTGPTGSIVINGGAAVTSSRSVTLTITASDSGSGMGTMNVFDDQTWNPEEPYSSSKAWTLIAGSGTKRVSVCLYDRAGNMIGVSDTIELNCPPTVSLQVNGGAHYTSSIAVTLNVAASDGDGSVTQMRFSNDGIAWSSWEPYGTTRVWTIEGSDGLKTIRIQVKDNSGLTSGATASITLNTAAPSAPLNLRASEDASGRITLLWDPPESSGGANILHYHVDKGMSSGGELVWDVTRPDTCNYVDPDVVPGSLYFYRVACSNLLGESPYSNEVAYSTMLTTVPLVSDGFDDGNIDGWTVSTDTSGTSVVEVVQPSGFANPALHIAYETATWARATSPEIDADFTDAFQISLKLYVPNPSPIGDSRVVVIDNGAVHLYDRQGTFYAGATAVGTVLYNQWQDIKVKVDPADETYVVQINGIYSAAIPFSVPGPCAKTVSLGSEPTGGHHQYGEAYFDDFAVWARAAISEPRSLAVTPQDDVAELRWTFPGSDGGREILSYNLYRGNVPGGEAFLVSIPGNAVEPHPYCYKYYDWSVENGLIYYYRMRAVTADGEGPLSSEVWVVPCGPPTCPRNLVATPGLSCIYLSWSAPEYDGGTPIASYWLSRNEVSGGGYNFIASTPGTTYTDTGLMTGFTYYYVVVARNAVYGSPMSNEAAAAPCTLPSAPLSLTAVAGNGVVTLSWSPPTSNGGASIAGYKVYRGASPGAESYLADAVTTSHTDSTVSNGQTYYYVVAAANTGGTGGTGNEVSARPTGPPSSPTNLAAAPGNGQVALTWAAPSNNGGSMITSYKIYRGTSTNGENLLTQVGGSSLTYTDTGLSSGQTYYYKVTAVNANGESGFSNEASETPYGTMTLPGEPLGLTAESVSGGVKLTWLPPASDGGGAINGYKVYKSTRSGQETLCATLGKVLNFTDNSVTSGKKYYYQVSALNSAFEGGKCSEVMITYTPPASPPSAPRSLTATPENAQTALRWTAPASNGDSTITAYNIYRGTTSGGETSLAQVSGTTLSYNNTGLTNGVTYYYKVTAVNAIGEGPYSNEASATPTSATVPGAPTNLAASATSTSIHLSWGGPSNGGSPITAYKIYRSTKSGAEALYKTVPASATSYDDTTVTKGKTYYYKVSAVNIVGESSLSGEASATFTGTAVSAGTAIDLSATMRLVLAGLPVSDTLSVSPLSRPDVTAVQRELTTVRG